MNTRDRVGGAMRCAVLASLGAVACGPKAPAASTSAEPAPARAQDAAAPTQDAVPAPAVRSLPLTWHGPGGVGYVVVHRPSEGTDAVWQLFEPRLDAILQCFVDHGRVQVRTRGCIAQQANLPMCGPGLLSTSVSFYYQGTVDEIIYDAALPMRHHPVDADFLDTEDHEPFWNCVQGILDRLAQTEDLDARLDDAAPITVDFYASVQDAEQHAGYGTIDLSSKPRPPSP